MADEMRITKIERQKKLRNRVSIFVDDQFAAGVSEETLLQAKLRPGDQISRESLDSLTADETLFQAKQSALRLLSYRPRSEKEIRNYLRTKEFSDENIDQVLSNLRTSGMVNDREFARAYIRNALTLRPIGRILLRRKLLLLGIEPTMVEEALNEECGPEDQLSAADVAAEKIMRRVGKRGDPDKAKSRLVAALLRKGFPYSVVKEVVAKHFSASSDE